jgi:hypothetical protein
VSLAARLREERGVVGVSLIRWTIILLILGVVVIEGASIIFTAIGLQNAADGAVAEAAGTWRRSQDLQAAKDAALRVLDESEQDDARLVSIDADATEPFEVRITVRKQASTLIVHRIGFLKDFARVEVDAEARGNESGI